MAPLRRLSLADASLAHKEIVMVEDGIEILLVEDNADDEILALHAFERSNIANRVHVVRDGAEALEYVFCTGEYVNRSSENPKVILLDLKLPLVDGIEVLRQIRSEPRTQLIPIVIFTSSHEERDVIETYRLRVNCYFVKPLDIEQFNELVRHLGYYWLLLNRQPASLAGSSPETTSPLGNA
jgi:two-component system response regulator